MYVITRSGDREPIKFDKITDRIETLCKELAKDVDPTVIAQKVIEGIFDGITTRELDQLAAETAAYLSTRHPDYAILAGRIAVSNLHKETKGCFSENIKAMYHYVNPVTGEHSPLGVGRVLQHRYKKRRALGQGDRRPLGFQLRLLRL